MKSIKRAFGEFNENVILNDRMSKNLFIIIIMTSGGLYCLQSLFSSMKICFVVKNIVMKFTCSCYVTCGHKIVSDMPLSTE